MADITHVALAFMRSDMFNEGNRTEWPLFTTIDEVRPNFSAGTVVQVAIGGWGDTAGFDKAARTDESRALFAGNVKKMLDVTGADGVDVDWEYPGYVHTLSCCSQGTIGTVKADRRVEAMERTTRRPRTKRRNGKSKHILSY